MIVLFHGVVEAVAGEERPAPPLLELGNEDLTLGGLAVLPFQSPVDRLVLLAVDQRKGEIHPVETEIEEILLEDFPLLVDAQVVLAG